MSLILHEFRKAQTHSQCYQTTCKYTLSPSISTLLVFLLRRADRTWICELCSIISLERVLKELLLMLQLSELYCLLCERSGWVRPVWSVKCLNLILCSLVACYFCTPRCKLTPTRVYAGEKKIVSCSNMVRLRTQMQGTHADSNTEGRAGSQGPADINQGGADN